MSAIFGMSAIHGMCATYYVCATIEITYLRYGPDRAVVLNTGGYT